MLKVLPAGVFVALAKNDLLYHATSLANAVAIVKGDKLHMVAASDVEERVMGRADVFWVSMARTKTSSYFVKFFDGKNALGVVFECDGRKLGQVIKSTPIDYWVGSAKERGHETEERLLGREPEISGFSRYVKTLHVIGEASSEQAKAGVASLVALCRKRKLPLLVYPDYRAWLARKGQEAGDVGEGAGQEQAEETNERREGNLAHNLKVITQLLEGWKQDSKTERMPQDVSPRDLPRYLNPKDIASYSPAGAKAIVNFMRRHKLKTTRNLVDFVTEKWQEKELLVGRRRSHKRALETWENLHDDQWLEYRLGKAGDNWESYCDVWREALLDGAEAGEKLGLEVPWDDNERRSLINKVRSFPEKLATGRAAGKLAPLLAKLQAGASGACRKLGQQPAGEEIAEAWRGALAKLVAAARATGPLSLDPLYEGVVEVARELRSEYSPDVSWPLYRRSVLAALDKAIG